MSRSDGDKSRNSTPRGQGKRSSRGQRHRASLKGRRDSNASQAKHQHGGRAFPPERDRSDRLFVQFTSGLGELVERALAVDLGPARIEYRDGSALAVQQEISADKVAALPYVRNAFVVLGVVPESDPARAADGAARRFGAFAAAPRSMSRVPQFRVMAQFAGQLVSIPADSRAKLEREILRFDGGVVQTRGSGREYWLIGRRGWGSTFLTMKIPKGSSARKPVAGEVAPELAALLARASQPSDQDVVLDPFAGTGSLLRARAELPHSKLIGSDLHRSIPQSGPAIRRLRQDGRVLSAIPDGSIDAVITDPPWGEFDELDEPAELFSAHSVATMHRVLHPHRGRVVLLVARRLEQVWVSQLEAYHFEVASTTGILVNGHPASVVAAYRRSRG